MPASALQETYRQQAPWFQAERSQLLRRVEVARKRSVLDLGAGTGETLDELRRRCSGSVTALDKSIEVLSAAEGPRLVGRAPDLPFPDASFDLVFTQMFFLWAGPLDPILAEIRRILQPAGHLIICAEPDYGGVIEHPAGSCRIAEFAAGLEAEGADTTVARKLPSGLQRAGFRFEAGSHPADPARSAHGFGGDAAEFLFIPYFWFLAAKPQ